LKSSSRRYALVHLAGLLCGLLVGCGTWLTSLTPNADGLIGPGGGRLPELCWRQASGLACRSCGLARSVVAASHGRFRLSHQLHPGGVWILGWLALHTTARALLLACRPAARWWRLDLVATCGSFLVCCLIVAQQQGGG
jgi:hypothetical protein